MAPPVQVTIDLNEVIKRAMEKIKDVQSFTRDSSEMVTQFRRELGRTEFYDKVVKRKVLEGSKSILETVGGVQHDNVIFATQYVYRCWDDFVTLVGQPYGLQSAATWPAQVVTETSSSEHGENQVPLRPARLRQVSWGVKGKSRAEGILEQIRSSNEFLKDTIDEVCKHFDTIYPHESTSLAEDLKTAEPHKAGLTTGIMRLAIQRGRVKTDKAMFKKPDFVGPERNQVFGQTSNLRQSLNGSTPVLVEYVPTEDFLPTAIDRVLRLAMLLSQPPVDGFGVLQCLGVCRNESKRQFEFIFDLSGPRRDMGQNGLKASAETALNGCHSLLSQLQGHNRHKEPKLLRYYRITEALIKPLSVVQRLTLAKTIASTVQQLHYADWVHGNITSSNIYFFHERKQTQAGLPVVELKGVYLFGFQFTRLTGDYSDRRLWGIIKEEDNIYRHPDRQVVQGGNPKKPHAAGHDIYSLGVIFLELGLGQPASDLKEHALQYMNKSASPAANASDYQTENCPGSDDVPPAQSHFMWLAENFLAEKMGEAFARLTRLCLSGEIRFLEAEEGEKQEVEELSVSSAFRLRVMEPLDQLLNALA